MSFVFPSAITFKQLRPSESKASCSDGLKCANRGHLLARQTQTIVPRAATLDKINDFQARWVVKWNWTAKYTQLTMAAALHSSVYAMVQSPGQHLRYFSWDWKSSLKFDDGRRGEGE